MTRAERIEAAERAVTALEDRTAAYDMGRAGPASHEERVAIVAAALDPESGGRDDADIALTLAGADLAATIAHAECLEIAEKWADHYPVDVFLPDGTSIEARAAHHARRVAGFIAEDIRKLAIENRPPAPSSPAAAQVEGREIIWCRCGNYEVRYGEVYTAMTKDTHSVAGCSSPNGLSGPSRAGGGA